MSGANDAAPRIDVAIPDISRWATGNAGIPYAWRFETPVAGPRVTASFVTPQDAR